MCLGSVEVGRGIFPKCPARLMALGSTDSNCHHARMLEFHPFTHEVSKDTDVLALLRFKILLLTFE